MYVSSSIVISNHSVIIIEQSGLGYNELVCNMMNMVPSMPGYNAMMSFYHI